MGTAKDIVLRPIRPAEANRFMRRVHYSGSVVGGSQVHIGVFFRGRLEGAIQFGPSLDKRQIIGLVAGTGWNEFIELNRLAFTDTLPRNSESRAIGVAMRLLRQYAPHLKWVVSFADAAQCGDGTIYRASGFVLTDIRLNKSLLRLSDGRVVHELSVKLSPEKYGYSAQNGSMGIKKFIAQTGCTPVPGYQLRYIYFLDKSYRERLTVPEIPYSKIWEVGAGMYRGEKCDEQRAGVA